MKRRTYKIAVGAALMALSMAMTSFGAGRADLEAGKTAAGGPGAVDTGAPEGAGDTAENTGSPVENGEIVPGNLGAAEQADQMVVVVGTGGCNADVSYYRKDETGGWQLAWREAGIVGRNGITDEKREGDGKTPEGTYRFTMPFGLKDDPGAKLPYHKVRQGDYWVDDSQSAHYNRLVNTSETARDWNSAENLATAYTVYNYALALSYNEECVPGQGSAIFLHCFTANPDNGSAGCIRLPEERARELVVSATEQTRIVIARDLEHLR